METLWKKLKQKDDNPNPTALDLLHNKTKDLQKTLQKSIESIKIFLTSQSIKITQSKKLQLFENSSIEELSKRENVDKLKEFYPKTIKQGELLYKASQNEFSTQKFYQMAGLSTDIMIICKTNKGKVIGAYTPLVLKNGTIQNHYAQDPTIKTFIFSLTENDKFVQKSKENAIFRTFNQQRVCFGNSEFQICDNAHTIEKCRSYNRLNNNFINKNYNQNQVQFYQKFNGNKGEYFGVVEWQAWKISFQQE